MLRRLEKRGGGDHHAGPSWILGEVEASSVLCFQAFYVWAPGGSSGGEGSPGAGPLGAACLPLPCVFRAVPCRAFGVPDTGLPTCPDDGGCLANSCCGVQPRLYRELSPRRQGDEPPVPGPHVPPLLWEPWPEGCGPPRFLVPAPHRTVGSPFLLSGSCRFARLRPGARRAAVGLAALRS